MKHSITRTTYHVFLLMVFVIALAGLQGCKPSSDLNSDLLDLSESLNPTQEFKISPYSDTTIVGKQGTLISIKTGSFVTKDGSAVETEVQINLKEVYSPSEMILNGLSTTSNGKLLETSGMINIQATSKGRKLELKSDSPLKISFKKINDGNYMRTFLGERDSLGMNWVIDKNNTYDTIKVTKRAEAIALLSNNREKSIFYNKTEAIIGQDTIDITNPGEFSPDIESIVSYSSQPYDTATSNDAVVDIPDFYFDSTSPESEITNRPEYQIYNTLHSTGLNWINCDRFLKLETISSFYIQNSDSNYSYLFLVFKDMNSIMGGWIEKDLAGFYNVPEGYEATIVSISKRDDKFYFAKETLTLEEQNEPLKMKSKELSLEEIKIELEKFDKDF